MCESIGKIGSKEKKIFLACLIIGSTYRKYIKKKKNKLIVSMKFFNNEKTIKQRTMNLIQKHETLKSKTNKKRTWWRFSFCC